MIKRSVSMPEEMWRKIDDFAKKHDRTPAYVIREILGESLEIPKGERHAG